MGPWVETYGHLCSGVQLGYCDAKGLMSMRPHALHDGVCQHMMKS